MTIENLPYFILYLISFLISIGVALITWRRRELTGARLYSVVAFTQSTIIMGYILELSSQSLADKIFWDDFQWIGFVVWAVLFPIFTLVFTRSQYASQQRTWILVSVVPVVFLILLMTNPSHGLVHNNEVLISGDPFDVLDYEFTPVVWSFAFYGYLVIATACISLFVNFFRTAPLYRAQAGTVVFGAVIPVFGTIFALFGITLSDQRDITPLTLAIGNLIVAIGLLRYKLFDIVPVAWDLVIQNMKDIVVVVDPKFRVVGLNKIARNLLAVDPDHLIGKPALDAFPAWETEVRKLRDQGQGEVELVTMYDDRINYFDAEVTPLEDRNGTLLGYVVEARNITRQKEMENQLRILNSNLELMVDDRTRELEEAYDSTLEGWAKALELKDKETEGHSRRVTGLVVQLAGLVNLSDQEIEDIRRGALLHDIGKMAIPDEILNKPGPLDESEWGIMKTHTVIAENLLSHISYLKKALEIPSFHHERWDGQGYPYGIRGEEIPLSARMFALIDNWDALLSDRPYRQSWPPEKVLAYFRENSGKIFDPYLTEIFLQMVASQNTDL